MQNLWENYRAAIILAALVVIGLMLSIYIVPEEEQAVVLRTGEPVRVAKLDATVGRATSVAQDVTPEFRFDGDAYVAPVELGGGNWNIRMEAIAGDGTAFQQRVVLIKD